MRASIASFGACALLACACTWAGEAGEAPLPSRILALFPHPGRSHQMVFEPLFRRLAERGHRVTVVSFFPVSDPPPPPTYRDVSLVGMSEIQLATLDLRDFDADLWGFERFLGQAIGMSMLGHYARDNCEKFLEWPTVQELNRSNETYDLILVENFNSDCMLGFAHRFKAPFVALLSHNLMAWSSDRLGLPDNPSYIPVMGTHFTDDMTLMQRLENSMFLYYFKAFHRYMIQLKEQAILERHFGHKMVDIGEIARNYSLMLINTHHSLNGVRPLVPGVVEVGGMHLERPRQQIPSNVERFLNESEHGVVVFSFGSLIRSDTMPRHKLDMFLRVFSRIPQGVIWKWEADDVEGRSDNVITLKWIPQYELLQHPKVIGFIAHGGLLGMTEAAAAGVPMLVIPFFGDQPGNAAAAQQAGLAEVLPYTHLNEENLYAALQKILSPELQASAARLSRVWRDRPAPPLDTAVYWVERTARLQHAQRLASRARRLPAYQLALLDVAALAAALLATLLFALYLLCKLILYCIAALTRTKLKVN